MSFYALPNELLIEMFDELDVKSYGALLLTAKLFSVIRFDLKQGDKNNLESPTCVINATQTFELPNYVVTFGNVLRYMALECVQDNQWIPVPAKVNTIGWIKRQLACAPHFGLVNHMYFLQGELFIGPSQDEHGTPSFEFGVYEYNVIAGKGVIKINQKGRDTFTKTMFPRYHPEREQGERDLLDKFTKRKFRLPHHLDRYRGAVVQVSFCRHFDDVDDVIVVQN